MTKFDNDVNNYLLQKIKSGEIAVTEDELSRMRINLIPNESGGLNYIISESVFNKLTPEILNQIDIFWNEAQ